MKIDHIQQQDVSGCGIACLSMLSGKTYQMVRNVFLGMGAIGQTAKVQADKITAIGGGITAGEMADLSAQLGITAQLPAVAPCVVSIKTEFGGHYVIITKEGKILDPNSLCGGTPTINL